MRTTLGAWGIVMNLKKLIMACGLAALGTTAAQAADLPTKKAPAPVAEAPFFFVNDNTFSLSYQYKATDPGVGTGGKTVLNFTHFDVWGWGTNFFTIDLLKSGKWDPSSPCQGPTQPALGCAGSTEIYGLFRSTVGFNQLFNTKAFAVGPLTNVSFEFGGDANTQNNYVGPAKRDMVLGLQFSFMLPYKGYFNISPLYYKEINHNAFTQAFPLGFGVPGIPDGDTDFRGTWALETNYAMDLGFIPMLPLTLSGYANWHGPKGTGTRGLVAGAIPTKIEFASEQKLSLDLGKMVYGPSKSHFLDVWVAYRYWQNKFGLDHTKGVCVGTKDSCTENTVASGVSVKF
jgi:nucleoside-specific outer membrane channel protein Tsx